MAAIKFDLAQLYSRCNLLVSRMLAEEVKSICSNSHLTLRVLPPAAETADKWPIFYMSILTFDCIEYFEQAMLVSEIQDENK